MWKRLWRLGAGNHVGSNTNPLLYDRVKIHPIVVPLDFSGTLLSLVEVEVKLVEEGWDAATLR